MLTGSEVLKQAEKSVDVDKAEDKVEVQRIKTIQDVSADSDNKEQEEGDEDGEELTPHP